MQDHVRTFLFKCGACGSLWLKSEVPHHLSLCMKFCTSPFRCEDCPKLPGLQRQGCEITNSEPQLLRVNLRADVSFALNNHSPIPQTFLLSPNIPILEYLWREKSNFVLGVSEKKYVQICSFQRKKMLNFFSSFFFLLFFFAGFWTIPDCNQGFTLSSHL